MILRILAALLPQIRTLQAELDAAKQKSAYWEAKYDAAREAATLWLEQYQKAEARADEVTRELIDKTTNAGDSLSLRHLGRRMFSKAPVEAPPSEPRQNGPVGVSSGSQKGFARDRVRSRSKETLQQFFQTKAESTGVIPQDAKPN